MFARLIATCLATAVASLSAVSPALAADGDNVPAGADREMWRTYVDFVKAGDAHQDWTTPRGSLIADSGFRPFSDGFSFFNTSKPDTTNNAVFGAPKTGPENLNATTIRDMMGERVCVEGNSEGACTLTLAGKLWRDSSNAAMAGGHCYGLASTASQLFAGQLAPDQFQSGATTTYGLGLRTPISRQIARNMASQFARSPSRFVTKPSRVVEDLRDALVPGQTPPVLIMFSKEGGHAVTPYALYGGDAGHYDVAVYDNNYPDFRRVVRLDTVKQTAQYAFQVNPDEPPVDPQLRGIGVVPADFITSKQPCPFCRDARHTRIQIEPVKSQVPLKVKVTRLDGSPMKRLEVTPPTSPWEPGQRWNFPSFRLPKGKAFLVTINARLSKEAITSSVLATTGQYAIGTEDVEIPAGSIGRVGLSTTTGTVLYRGKDPGEGRLSFVDTANTRSVSLSGRVVSQAETSLLAGTLVGKRKTALLYSLSSKAGRAVVKAKLQYYQSDRAQQKSAVIRKWLPDDAGLAISYAGWKPSDPEGLRVHMLRGQERTPVKVRFR